MLGKRRVGGGKGCELLSFGRIRPSFPSALEERRGVYRQMARSCWTEDDRPTSSESGRDFGELIGLGLCCCTPQLDVDTPTVESSSTSMLKNTTSALEAHSYALSSP